MANLDVMYSSKTDQWATPADFFNELDREFHFDLDPCADEHNHKCERYFTEAQNGLTQDWGGAVCSAILPTERLSAIGFGSATKNLAKKTQSWCCLSLPEQTQNIFTTTSCIGLRYGL